MKSGHPIQREDITGLKPYLICRKGISCSYQVVNIFHRLTVFENVRIAVLSFQKKSFHWYAAARKMAVEETQAILKSVGLADKAEQNQAVGLRLADRGYVIDNGAIRYHGTRRDLAENEEVRRKYLCVLSLLGAMNVNVCQNVSFDSGIMTLYQNVIQSNT